MASRVNVLKPVPGSSCGGCGLRSTVGAAPMRVTNRIAALASWVEASTSRIRSPACPMLEVVLPALSLVSPNAPIPATPAVVLRPGS